MGAKRALRALALGVLGAAALELGPAGCGSGSSSEPTTAAFDLPTVVSLGGPVLAAPRVQPIYYAGFPHADEIDGFLQRLAGSSYWTTIASEYGVGAPTVAASVRSGVAVARALMLADLTPLLEQTFQADAAALHAPDSGTIYALFFSPDTSITVSGATLCESGAPSGFHFETQVAGQRVPVVVVPTCASLGDSGLTGADAITPPLSHELVEAATDPFPTTEPAFADTDQHHPMWAQALAGAEIADLCENEAPNLTMPADIGSPVQRIWSNAAVAAGTGPCVPVPPGEVYFNAVARLPDTITIERYGMRVPIPVLSAAVGATATTSVEFRSDGDSPASWSAAAIEVHTAAKLTARPMPVTGRRAEMHTLTIATPESSAGIFPFVVVSRAGDAVHLWVGTIQRQ
jgi:hypothetical protein